MAPQVLGNLFLPREPSGTSVATTGITAAAADAGAATPLAATPEPSLSAVSGRLPSAAGGDSSAHGGGGGGSGFRSGVVVYGGGGGGSGFGPSGGGGQQTSFYYNALKADVYSLAALMLCVLSPVGLRAVAAVAASLWRECCAGFVPWGKTLWPD
jgi:hypothetical protein